MQGYYSVVIEPRFFFVSEIIRFEFNRRSLDALEGFVGLRVF